MVDAATQQQVDAAWAHQPDQRDAAGDAHWRCMVQGMPAPEDVLAALQAAAAGQAAGLCRTPDAAALLLSRLSAQRWQLLPLLAEAASAGAAAAKRPAPRSQRGELTLRVRVGHAEHVLHLQRHPELVLTRVA